MSDKRMFKTKVRQQNNSILTDYSKIELAAPSNPIMKNQLQKAVKYNTFSNNKLV